MSETQQQLIAVAMIAIAAIYLGRRIYRSMFKTSGGGCSSGCGKCAASEPAVIGIQPLGKKAD